MPDHAISERRAGSRDPRATSVTGPVVPCPRAPAFPAGRGRSTTKGALLSPRSLQLCLGTVWLLVGALQVQPFMFGHGFVTKVILPNAMGQPAAVAVPITLAAHLMTRYPVLLNSLFAGVQILIGLSMIRLALLGHDAVRLVLVASMLWAVSVWWIGEGLGGLLTGTASPLTGAPGAVLLYALLSYLAWPSRKAEMASPTGASRFGGASPAVATPPTRGEGLPGQVLWAVLWAGSAAMLLAPANRTAQSIRSQILGAASGEPGWLASFLRTVAGAASGHGAAITLSLAIASLTVGIGVFVPRARKAALVLGAALSLGYWVVGQAFGGILTGTGTDPNAGPLFVLLALALTQGGMRVPAVSALLPRIHTDGSRRSAGSVSTTTAPSTSEDPTSATRLGPGRRTRWPSCRRVCQPSSTRVRQPAVAESASRALHGSANLP